MRSVMTLLFLILHRRQCERTVLDASCRKPALSLEVGRDG